MSRLLTYCGKDIRFRVINSMFSNIVKMTSHAYSNAIIDVVYLTYATTEQKNFMMQEFYSDLYKSVSINCTNARTIRIKRLNLENITYLVYFFVLGQKQEFENIKRCMGRKCYTEKWYLICY